MVDAYQVLGDSVTGSESQLSHRLCAWPSLCLSFLTWRTKTIMSIERGFRCEIIQGRPLQEPRSWKCWVIGGGGSGNTVME